jgi:hypothetical protein
MSRQNKNSRKIALRKQVTATHKQGGKIPFTKKLTSVNKGRCVTVKGVRQSINTSNQSSNSNKKEDV